MKNKLAYHILAISIIAIWGVTFINTKFLILNGLNPQEIFLLRFILAYIGIWTFSPHKLFTDNWRDELTTLMLGITGGSLYFWAENTAIQYSLVNNVAFINVFDLSKDSGAEIKNRYCRPIPRKYPRRNLRPNRRTV